MQFHCAHTYSEGQNIASNFAAEHLKSLAKQLCRLGPRQLQTVSPILEVEPEILEAISTAKAIDATNQVSLHSYSVCTLYKICRTWACVS